MDHDLVEQSLPQALLREIGPKITTFDVPGSLSTNALDINNRGQIAGVYADAQPMGHGYVRDRNGAFATIDVPGAALTFPLGINNRGHVVGMDRDANQVGHGFLYRDATITTIDHPLASDDSWPQDVNERGQIVGFYERGGSDSTVDARSSVASESVPARWQIWGPKRLG